MASLIKEKLFDKTKWYNYKDAGHVFYGPSVFYNVNTGGEYDANVNALIDSNKKLLEFLSKDFL